MTSRFSDAFSSQRIVFGAGETARLAELVKELGVERVLLCTSGSYVRNGAAARVSAALGRLCAATCGDVRPHVPAESVATALDAARAANADAVLALGGGSAIGTGKAVTARLSDAPGTPIPLIAVPATYAGSEMTSVYGVTWDGEKRTVSDPRVLPRLVVYDPDLTLDLPPHLTAGTAANALAHCVEGVYSQRRTPLATAAALRAAGLIRAALPRLMEDGGDGEARETMLTGAHLAGVTIAHAGMALHHAICHALGGAGVPHGDAHAIMLPHVMRFNLPAASAEIAAVGRAMQPSLHGLATGEAAESAVARVHDLLRGLPLPQRLQDVGIAPDALPSIAAHALGSATARANPRPATLVEVEEILRSAW